MPSGRRTAWMLIAAAALGAACNTAPTEQLDALDQARQRWADEGGPRYELTLNRACFCGGPLRVRLEVDGDEIVRTDLDTGEPVPQQFEALFPDVPGLFDLIEEEILRPAAAVIVTYHGTLGYPLSISVDRIKNAIDDEYTLTIVEFELLP